MKRYHQANKMVATERRQRADVQEELKEARLEKEALRSALKLLEDENEHLRSSGSESGSKQGSPTVPYREYAPAQTTSPLPMPNTQVPPASTSSPPHAHLPPSLSFTRAPPPEPLPIPTTPFDYGEDTSDSVTPRYPPHRDNEAASTIPATGAEPEAALEEQPKPAPQRDPVPAPAWKPEPHPEPADKPPNRPPSLNLMPHEHDPWADAPSSARRVGGVLGDTV